MCMCKIKRIVCTCVSSVYKFRIYCRSYIYNTEKIFAVIFNTCRFQYKLLTGYASSIPPGAITPAVTLQIAMYAFSTCERRFD